MIWIYWRFIPVRKRITIQLLHQSCFNFFPLIWSVFKDIFKTIITLKFIYLNLRYISLNIKIFALNYTKQSLGCLNQGKNKCLYIVSSDLKPASTTPGMLSIGICRTPSLKHVRPGYTFCSFFLFISINRLIISFCLRTTCKHC